MNDSTITLFMNVMKCKQCSLKMLYQGMTWNDVHVIAVLKGLNRFF